jgi:hypothetical protein
MTLDYFLRQTRRYLEPPLGSALAIKDKYVPHPTGLVEKALI